MGHAASAACPDLDAFRSRPGPSAPFTRATSSPVADPQRTTSPPAIPNRAPQRLGRRSPTTSPMSNGERAGFDFGVTDDLEAPPQPGPHLHVGQSLADAVLDPSASVRCRRLLAVLRPPRALRSRPTARAPIAGATSGCPLLQMQDSTAHAESHPPLPPNHLSLPSTSPSHSVSGQPLVFALPIRPQPHRQLSNSPRPSASLPSRARHYRRTSSGPSPRATLVIFAGDSPTPVAVSTSTVRPHHARPSPATAHISSWLTSSQRTRRSQEEIRNYEAEVGWARVVLRDTPRMLRGDWEFAENSKGTSYEFFLATIYLHVMLQTAS